MSYTISVQDENGHRVPIRRAKATKDEAMLAAWKFSQQATLCDVVATCGSKHIATYRRGVVKLLNGKERKP